MRFRASGRDLTTEILDALGARQPLWRRTWVDEDELRDLASDRRRFAHALTEIGRMDGVLLHIRDREDGRSFFLAKVDPSKLTVKAAPTLARRYAKPLASDAAEDVPPDDDTLVPQAEGKPARPAVSAALSPRPSPDRGALSSHGSTSAGEVERAIKDVGVRFDKVDPEAIAGPTIVRYRVYLAPGERVRHLQWRSEDLARGLGSEVFVSHVPGERWVAVDVPRKDRQVVPLESVLARLASMDDPAALWIPVGVSPSGEPALVDLTLVPHLLVAGGTGGGKSVWLRAVLLSLVLRYAPSDLEVLLIDPKAVDYAPFSSIPHLLGQRLITEPEEAVEMLMALTEVELARRTRILQESQCSNFRELRSRGPRFAAKYLVIVLDEFADLAVTLDKAARAEFERQILRLAQRGRAAGIFLVLATQRPTVEFITGAVKANLPTRISFRLPQRCDSQVILDEPGAEDLLGAGDLIYRHDGRLQRLQGYFASMEDAFRLLERDRALNEGMSG